MLKFFSPLLFDNFDIFDFFDLNLIFEIFRFFSLFSLLLLRFSFFLLVAVFSLFSFLFSLLSLGHKWMPVRSQNAFGRPAIWLFVRCEWFAKRFSKISFGIFSILFDCNWIFVDAILRRDNPTLWIFCSSLKSLCVTHTQTNTRINTPIHTQWRCCDIVCCVRVCVYVCVCVSQEHKESWSALSARLFEHCCFGIVAAVLMVLLRCETAGGTALNFKTCILDVLFWSLETIFITSTINFWLRWMRSVGDVQSEFGGMPGILGQAFNSSRPHHHEKKLLK